MSLMWVPLAFSILIFTMRFPGLLFANSNQGHISYSLRFSLLMTCHGSKGFFFTFPANDLNVSLCSFKLIFQGIWNSKYLPLDVHLINFMLFFNIYVTLLILTLLSLIALLWFGCFGNDTSDYCWEGHCSRLGLFLIAASWDIFNTST